VIPVVKPYLPDREKLERYIDEIYERAWLTNNGPLVQRLTIRLAEYLGLDAEHVILTANGSLALHLAYKALDLKGEVITTPFSFVASSSSILWEGLTPVFCDIDSSTLNLAPELIERKLTDRTSAIMPVHVFGNPCDVDSIQHIADNHGLKVIYDASHCFGVDLKGESILLHGDISTLSFHATKLFHSVEGGALVAKDRAVASKLRKMINFGIGASGTIEHLGINAKMSEFHAAVGLAVLDEIESVRASRTKIWGLYLSALQGVVGFPARHPASNNNCAYFPILLNSESVVLLLVDRLRKVGIEARRYFYPSLDSLDIFPTLDSCSVSGDVSSRILCLPLFPSLAPDKALQVIEIVKEGVKF